LDTLFLANLLAQYWRN